MSEKPTKAVGLVRVWVILILSSIALRMVGAEIGSAPWLIVPVLVITGYAAWTTFKFIKETTGRAWRYHRKTKLGASAEVGEDKK